MNIIEQTITWLLDPATWSSDGHNMLARSIEHLQFSGLAVLIAAVLAIPTGWVMGHLRKFSGVIMGITGAARALPTLGLITLFGLLVGIGLMAPMIALIIMAIPSILAGTYSGITAIQWGVVDAARAQGFTTWQIVTRVHLPLGLTMMLGGLRSASIQVMSTAILAAYVGAGGLGRFIFLGINTRDTAMLLGASLWIMVLVIVLDLLFAVSQRLATPTGVRNMNL